MSVSLISTKATSPIYSNSVLPICSSSTAIYPNQHETNPLSQSLLHQELMANGLVDEQGDITDKAKDLWKPIPLNQNQLKRLQHVLEKLNDEKISLTHCLSFLEKMYPDGILDLRLIGGAAIWVLGWEYYLNTLSSLGIPNPERFFPEHIQNKFNEMNGDYDFRALTTAKMAASFPQVENDLENMVKGKLRKSQLDWTLCQRFNRPRNLSLYIQMKSFELVLYNKLGATFLYGHKAVEIPCKAALHGGPIYPESSGIDFLQGLMDQLLTRLNPFPTLNEQGSIRQAVAITEGFGVWNQALFDKLGGRKFILPKDRGLGEYLREKIDKINQGHPSNHPAADYFNMMNGMLLFGRSMNKDDHQKYWAGFTTGASLLSAHSSLSSLYTLWGSGKVLEQQLPVALIGLTAFVQELFQLDPSVTSKVMYMGINTTCGLQLQYKTNMATALHLQTQVNLVQAYQQFIGSCLKLSDLSQVEAFFKQLSEDQPIELNRDSLLLEQWKSLGLELRELRRLVVNQLHHNQPAIRALNFYLLAVLHAMEPLPVTENALLLMIPLIHEQGLLDQASLSNLIGVCLGSHFENLFRQYVEEKSNVPNTNCVYLWIKVVFRQLNSAKASKLAVLLPRFQQYLPNILYDTALQKSTQAMINDYPEQCLLLLENAMDKVKVLESFHFTLFCKTVFPFLNPNFFDLLTKLIEKLGSILLRLCEAKIEGITSTTAREMVLYRLIDTLLNLSFEGNPSDLGQRIVFQLTDEHPYTHLIGIYMHQLRKKAFPNGIQPSLTSAFVARIEEIRNLIARKNIEMAVTQILKLVTEEGNASSRQALEEELVHISKLLEARAITGNIPAIITLLELVHNDNVIDKFFYFSLEGHMLIMDIMSTCYMKFRPQTNKDILQKALKHFFGKIPKRIIVDYIKTIVSILSRAWIPTEPLARETVALLKLHYPTLITQLGGHAEVQSTLTSLIYNCGAIEELTTNENMIEIAERSLRDPAATRADQCTYLKIIQKCFLTQHPRLSLEQYLFFAEKCFSFNQISTGQEWLKHVFDSLEKDKISISDNLTNHFQHIFRILHENGSFQVLMSSVYQYQKLKGNMNAAISVFSDEAIMSAPEFVLQILELLPPNSVEIGLYSNVLGRYIWCTARITKSVVTTIDDFWLRCLRLLANFPPVDPHCWTICCATLGSSMSAKVKVRALRCVLDGIDKNIIPEGPIRAELWYVLICNEPDLNKKTVLELIERPNLFHTLFFDSSTGLVSPKVYICFMIMLQPFCRDPEMIHAELIFRTYERILEYPTTIETADLISKLNQTVYSALGTQIPHTLYVKLFTHVSVLLSLTTPKEREDETGTALTLKFFGMSSQNSHDIAEQKRMLLSLVDLYGSELWLAKTLCRSLTYLNPEVVKVVKGVIVAALNKFLEHHSALTPEQEAEFKDAFATIVIRGRFSSSADILELIYSEPIRTILRKNHEDMVIRFIHIVFSVVKSSEIPKDESLYETQRIILEDAMATFFPLQDCFTTEVQMAIWKCAIDLIFQIFLRAPSSKKMEQYEIVEHLCNQNNTPGHQPSDFYENLDLVFDRVDILFSKYPKQNRFGFQAGILHQRLSYEEANHFVGIANLIKLIDKFCFEKNPTTKEEKNWYRAECMKMITRFDNLALSYPDVLNFHLRETSCLRGMRHGGYDYIERLVRSRSIWSLSRAAHQISTNIGCGTLMQKTNLIAALLINLDMGPYFITKNINSLTKCCQIAFSFISMLLETNDTEYELQFPHLLESYINVYIKKSNIASPSYDYPAIHPVYKNITEFAKMLFLTVLKGSFSHFTFKYWKICRTLIQFYQTLDPIGAAMSIEFTATGFYLLSAETMKELDVDIENSADYRYVRANTIDKYVTYFTSRNNSQEGLFELLDSEVESLFSHTSLWQEMKTQLNTAAALELAENRTPLKTASYSTVFMNYPKP